MKKLLTIAALAVGLTSSAAADDNIVVGVGANEEGCALWLKARRSESPAANNQALQFAIVGWTQGYLTAKNDYNNVSLPGPETIRAVLDMECRKDPTQLIFAVANELYFKAAKRQGKSPDPQLPSK